LIPVSVNISPQWAAAYVKVSIVLLATRSFYCSKLSKANAAVQKMSLQDKVNLATG
jgi:hypothetical protein